MQSVGGCGIRMLKSIVPKSTCIFATQKIAGSSAISNSSNFEDRMNYLSIGGVRFKGSGKRPNVKMQRKEEGGINYHGFTYFPRTPDHKDPPYEPSKLFMVKRIRSLRGLPYWEKEAIWELNLGNRSAVTIVKNTPENNQRLYKVKHVIEITPIKIPYGMPDNPRNGFLKENGDFIAFNSLEGHKMQIEDAQKQNDELLKKSVDGPTLKYRLKKRFYEKWE